jgi:hypothetical protein
MILLMRAGDLNEQNAFEDLIRPFENVQISNEDRFLGHVDTKIVWVDIS